MTLTPDEIRQHQEWLDWIATRSKSDPSEQPPQRAVDVRFDELTLLREIVAVMRESLNEDQRAAIVIDAWTRLKSNEASA